MKIFLVSPIVSYNINYKAPKTFIISVIGAFLSARVMVNHKVTSYFVGHGFATI